MNSTIETPRPSAATGYNQVQPYLFFEGRCAEALDFYRRKLGAEIIMLMHYKDAPTGDVGESCAGRPGPELADKVMHASFRIGATEVCASDGQCDGNATFHGFALSLTTKDTAAAERAFAALADGGEVREPLTTTFFSPRFGMVADRFGVLWIIYTLPPSGS